MPNTYSQIYLQIVFAVRNDLCLIPGNHKSDLHRYITAVIQHQGNKLIAINSMPDHLHILLGMRPDRAPSDLVRDIKTNSAKLINEQRWIRGKFGRQEGFGAFSYSRSQIPNVARYIENQEAHHHKRTFREEYVKFLEKFEIEYDPRYLLRW